MHSLKVKKCLMKAAKAFGNNESGIPIGNKERNIARLRAFCGDHCSTALKAVQKGVCRSMPRYPGAIPLKGREGVGLNGSMCFEKAERGLKRRYADRVAACGFNVV